jgi:hypothetical protein
MTLKRLVLFTVALVAVNLAGCGGKDRQTQPQTVTLTPPATTSDTTTGSTEASEEPWEKFDRHSFDRSTTIDNEWMPLAPGTQFVYEGSTVEGGRRVGHRLVSIVTDLTKVVEGVPTVVIWERDFSAGKLVEAELALFAQDNDGAVWHFGQYPEEYEKGRIADTPAWIAWIQNARPGIVMKAKPEPGAPSYSQGWGPAVNWTDRAQATASGKRTCVPTGCYEDVLVIEEFSQEDPGAFQLKYYARGVGNVRVGWKGNDPSKEVLKLVAFGQLSPAALAEARVEALELEKRAYRISKDVYAHTEPAEAL